MVELDKEVLDDFSHYAKYTFLSDLHNKNYSGIPSEETVYYYGDFLAKYDPKWLGKILKIAINKVDIHKLESDFYEFVENELPQFIKEMDRIAKAAADIC